MQIRIGNKQDEQGVRDLLAAERALDLSGRDADLRKIELHYFGNDGVFLVAEERQKVFGFATAIKLSDTTCALKRLFVRVDRRNQGAGSALLRQVIGFARKLDYMTLSASEQSVAGDGLALLERFGFQRAGEHLELSL